MKIFHRNKEKDPYAGIDPRTYVALGMLTVIGGLGAGAGYGIHVGAEALKHSEDRDRILHPPLSRSEPAQVIKHEHVPEGSHLVFVSTSGASIRVEDPERFLLELRQTREVEDGDKVKKVIVDDTVDVAKAVYDQTTDGSKIVLDSPQTSELARK